MSNVLQAPFKPTLRKITEARVERRELRQIRETVLKRGSEAIDGPCYYCDLMLAHPTACHRCIHNPQAKIYDET